MTNPMVSRAHGLQRQRKMDVRSPVRPLNLLDAPVHNRQMSRVSHIYRVESKGRRKRHFEFNGKGIGDKEGAFWVSHMHVDIVDGPARTGYLLGTRIARRKHTNQPDAQYKETHRSVPTRPKFEIGGQGVDVRLIRTHVHHIHLQLFERPVPTSLFS